MAKCQLCKAEAIWAWQPFGPGDPPGTLATLGSHYRGFPVVKVCEYHADRVRTGRRVDFGYGPKWYAVQDGELIDYGDTPDTAHV